MNNQHQAPILCTRAEAARLLGCSVATVVRLQREGRLCGLRLTDRANGQIYFRREDIVALATQETANAD
jgi:predicted site-specific integrase-resolvase